MKLVLPDFSAPRARLVLELSGVVLLFVLALALRIPHFQTIPSLTDEFKEVGWALDAHENGTLPLVAFDAYDGPLFTYFLLFLFRLVGSSIFLPRLLVLFIGALSVVAVFYLGKLLARGDWRVGAAAALLYAANAHHILFNSHVAWSSDTSPFFTTLTLLAYLYATRWQRPAWLIAAGLGYGLALQSHPSTLALALPLVIDFLLRTESRALLRTPFPYLGVLGIVVAYSPVLVYNLQSNFETLRAVSRTSYALQTAPSLSRTLQFFIPNLYAIARVAYGSFATDSLTTPAALFLCLSFAGLTLGACLWMARRGEIFPLVLTVCAALFFAVFNRFVSIPDSGRYFQFLIPVIYIAWSQAGLWLAERVGQRGGGWRGVGKISFIACLLALCAFSLFSLQRFYEQTLAAGRDNSSVLQMVERTRSPAETPVLLEWKLADLRTGRGGNIADNLVYFMRLDGRKPVLVSTGTPDALGGLENYLREHETAYLVGFDSTPAALGDEFPLQPLIATHFPCASCPSPNEFTLYWWQQP